MDPSSYIVHSWSLSIYIYIQPNSTRGSTQLHPSLQASSRRLQGLLQVFLLACLISQVQYQHQGTLVTVPRDTLIPFPVGILRPIALRLPLPDYNVVCEMAVRSKHDCPLHFNFIYHYPWATSLHYPGRVIQPNARRLE
jgi:hypothetical protein